MNNQSRDRRLPYLAALGAGTVIIAFVLIILETGLYESEIKLNSTKIHFLINDSNDWLEKKVILISNPSSVRLSTKLQNFDLSLPRPSNLIGIDLSPVNTTQKMNITFNVSTLLSSDKSSYSGQIQVIRGLHPIERIYVEIELANRSNFPPQVHAVKDELLKNPFITGPNTGIF